MITDPPEIIKTLLLYAGRSMSDFPRPRNPCITAREAIVIADHMVKLILELDKARDDIYQLGVKCARGCGDDVPRTPFGYADALIEKCDALRAEVERLRGHITQIWDACQIASHKPASSPYLTRLWMRMEPSRPPR